MSDLISREAAIDALGEEPEVWSGKDEYAQGLNNQWHYDVNALKSLPSAQPEQAEYIQDTKAVPDDRDMVCLSERVTATYYDDEHEEWSQKTVTIADVLDSVCDDYTVVPSAQPEISRIEQELHGKTPEEQYEFLYWLLLKFGLAYTDSRLAVIEWLRGEKEDG